MAIRSDTFFWAVCDRCGESITEGEEGGYLLHETEPRAREDVECYDGRIEADGTFTCCTCIEDGFEEVPGV